MLRLGVEGFRLRGGGTTPFLRHPVCSRCPGGAVVIRGLHGPKLGVVVVLSSFFLNLKV